MLKITNQKILLFGIIATLLFNIAVLSGFNIGFISSVYSFLYLSIIPGFFIYRLLRIRGISFFESIAFIVGLSISYLLLVGLSTNVLVIFPSIPGPLNMQNSLIVFDIYMTLLLFINHMRKSNNLLSITMPKVKFIELFFYIVALFFPVLSILGTDLLNSNGVNTLIMVLLASIAIYVVIIIIFMKMLKEFHYELPVYLIAISLLFMFSLRSSSIIGWDIYTEYKVFMLTETHQLWSMANYPDPYNACLSITILPTLFHYFTKVDNAYVYKILFQCLFALTPIVVYSLAKKFGHPLVAFLCTFFFMSTLDFFLEMPALVRQETAYLFFGLILLTLFNKQMSGRQKKLLFVIFSFSVVLSHYSTAYILIAIFGFACICLVIYKKIAYKYFHIVPEDFTLKPLPVTLFIAFAFLWFGIITNIAGNIGYVLIETSANITNFGQHTLNTSIFDQLFASTSEDPQILLSQQLNDTLKSDSQYKFTYYPQSTYKNYTPTIIDKDVLPLHVPVSISNLVYFVGSLIVKIMKVLLFFGFIWAIVLFRKKLFSAEYTILSMGFAVALILITSVPAISLFYPLGRLDQQALFLIALPAILAISRLLQFVPYRIRILFIATLFITYYIFTNTFVFQLTGGQDPQVFLNNSGLYYNEVYIHQSEIASIHWLNANNKQHLTIFADIGSTEKMIGYGDQKDISAIVEVFPSLIDKNGLVYSNYANTVNGVGITSPKDTRMEYNFPNEFLTNNKNLIYNNKDTRIYK